MGTLASQREIGVCVQAPRGVAMHRGSQLPAPTQTVLVWAREVAPSATAVWGITPQNLRFYMQNPAMWCIFGRKWTILIAHLLPSVGRSRQIYTIVLQTDRPLIGR